MNIAQPLVLCLCPLLLLAADSFSGPGPRARDLLLQTPAGTVAFSPDTGAITAVTPKGSASSVWHSGESGLWSARFADKTTLDASRFHTTNTLFAFSWKSGPGKDTLSLTYACASLTVNVLARSRPDGIELIAETTPSAQPLLHIDLPGRLRFDPATVTRLVFPHNGNTALGAAFNRRFFQQQPEDRPSGWNTLGFGPKGYQTLCGGPLVSRDTRDPAVPLTVTDEGRRWLSPSVASRTSAAKAVVNRAPGPGQADLVLIDSSNGPYLSASRLGGIAGGLWRIGASVNEDDAPTALTAVSSVIEKLASAPAAPRTLIGLVSLTSGPESGNLARVGVATWRDRLAALAARSRGRVAFVELASPLAMLDAARRPDFLCILNPYGEAIPAPSDDGMSTVLAAIRGYVKAGGNWFEVGGYSFYQALRPHRYLSYTTSYPTAFSDFLHLDSGAGCAALYRVQPRTVKQPWDAAQSPADIFVPGALACGGDERGGYCDHAFDTYVKPGETWRTPAVRLTLGTPVYEDLARYTAANGLTRPLTDKVKPDTLARLKQSVLVFISGSAREKTAALDRLPVPTLVHFSDYLKGGFDKQYPDHLPPNQKFGSPEELKAFFDRAHALGHLVSPYTNPTWWCDHPKGPTFEREGDAALLKGLDGKPIYERYSDNDGWTITLWHPAVQTANRVTVRQFTKDYPVDILFQDQCGARRWNYDTNPASPTPYAYSEGMIAMNDEDSRIVPLGTENGWDRVANYQALLCGLSWGIVPTDHRPEWVRLFKATVPPDTWEIFPLALAVMRDKAIFMHHDLGQFVTNDRILSWTLALGYSLSYRAHAPALEQDAPREWLAWLDRLQKSVCARHLGTPLRDFSHDRAPLFATPGDPRREADDGVITAAYGDVKLFCNLGDVPRTVGDYELPPYGFRAEAPGITAGLAPDGSGYVTETRRGKTDLWIFAPSQATVTLPVPLTGRVKVTLDGKTTLDTRRSTLGASISRQPSAISLSLPPRGSVKRIPPPAELATLAPRDRPGAKPAIGVIDLGPGLTPALTSLTPAAWRAAFEASALAKQHGLSVMPLASYAEVAAALAAGSSKYFAVINPYGEVFPAPGAGRWREALDAVRGYVNNGGIWWETAAYSFHRAAYREGDAWKTESTGPAGLSHLRLPIGNGEVDRPAEPLSVTETGKEWLGEALAAKIAQQASCVNRGTPSSAAAPATVLVSGVETGFIGGYRLDGWGSLWRVGGFNPDPEVTTAVATAATLHQYTTPPAPLPPAGTRFLYHVTLTPDSFWQRVRAWF
jgi:hypothetical protein